jgi:hypothetical protein
MTVVDGLVRLGDRLSGGSTRVYVFLFTYLLALVSLLSYAYLNSGNGSPSSFEFAMIFIAVMVGFLLALDTAYD